MTIARREIVAEGVEGFYHCVSRCVRRAFLCGHDPYSGRSFEHRKAWVKHRLKLLAESFGIEVCAYAIMSNHLHLVLRTRPDLVENWSKEEVARRWLLVFPKRRGELGRKAGPSAQDLKALSSDDARMAEVRMRLGSVSWFMRCLNENIARRANHEDDCKGRFWEGRFKCQALLDEASLLTCMAYVDLNPVRAGTADAPEQSEFTSIYDRVRALRRDAERLPRTEVRLCPIGREHGPEQRGLFEITINDYLEIIDETGRLIREGSSGAIPLHLEPILKRLGVQPQSWPRTVKDFGGLFQRVAGRVESIRAEAKRVGRRWLCGLKAGGLAFR